DADTSLQDFYWRYARNKVKVDPKPKIVQTRLEPNNYTQSEIEKIAGEARIYELNLSNKGGLVMPVIIEWTYKDGTKEVERLSAQVWRKNENNFTKSFIKYKEVASIQIDPMRETADIDESNNTWNVPG